MAGPQAPKPAARRARMEGPNNLGYDLRDGVASTRRPRSAALRRRRAISQASVSSNSARSRGETIAAMGLAEAVELRAHRPALSTPTVPWTTSRPEIARYCDQAASGGGVYPTDGLGQRPAVHWVAGRGSRPKTAR